MAIETGRLHCLGIGCPSTQAAAAISQIESSVEVAATVNTELVSGLLKNVGGYPMIMVLDFAKLIEGEKSSV